MISKAKIFCLRALFVGFSLQILALTVSAQPAALIAYEGDFRYAFLRVISDNDYSRLRNAILDDNQTEREQILRSNNIFTLNDFLNRIDDQLRPIRVQIRKLEARLNQGDRSVTAQINALESRYSQMKLAYDQLSAMIYFYQWYSPDQNQLIEGKGLTRAESRVANQAVRVTRWAYVPRRTHNENEPAPEFDRQKWADVRFSFQRFGIKAQFGELWSQLINFQGRHQTYRHIVGFEEMFYTYCRGIALAGDPFRARRLLLASLSNTESQAMIERYGDDVESWPKQSRVQSSLARFVVGLAAIKDGAQLIRFFGLGHLPPSIPKPKSALADKFLNLYATKGIGSAEQIRAIITSCRKRPR